MALQRMEHVGIVVNDIGAVLAGLRPRGAERVGEQLRVEDAYRLCCVRGPEAIIIELTQRIG